MMRLFRRKPKPPVSVPPPSTALPAGEDVERSVNATLLQGKAAFDGSLYMTNRRLLFEAKKGDTRWLVVPWAEVRSSGLYPAPGNPMGRPVSRNQCLFIETTKGEQVWWDFGEPDEREWLPAVKAHAAAARETAPEDA